MSYSDYYGILTYQDPLLAYKIENFDYWQHRDWVVKRDPFVKKFINGLDCLMFQELLIFVPDILETDTEQDPQLPEDGESEDEIKDVKEVDEVRLEPWEGENILLDWNKERWDDLLIKMYDSARTHKWCVLCLYDEPPYWFVFTRREIIEIEYDTNDNPIRVHAMWSKRLPLATTVIYHDIWINLLENKAELKTDAGTNTGMGLFVNWGHDIDENIDGSDLEHVWSLAVELRYIRFDILCNSARSSGFFHVVLGRADDKTEIERKIQEAFELAGNSKVFAADRQTVEEITAQYAKNPEFSIEAMDKIMKIFGGATNLPYLFYNSEKDTAGVFEENSSEMMQINTKKREIFSKLKHYVLKLVEMRWGVICEDVFLNIPKLENEVGEDEIIDNRTPGDNRTASEIKKLRLQK